MVVEHLTDEDIEALVWNFVSEYLEKTENLPVLLKDIGYIDDLESLFNEIDFLEDFDSEIEINNINESDDSIAVSFDINAIISAWRDQNQLLRITVNAVGTCLIKSSESIEMVDIQYNNVECDDIRAI